jgi:hypothetical protein
VDEIEKERIILDELIIGHNFDLMHPEVQMQSVKVDLLHNMINGSDKKLASFMVDHFGIPKMVKFYEQLEKGLDGQQTVQVQSEAI